MPPTLIAQPLARWVDPAAAYDALVGDDPHGFWLDAGPAATTGWSWLGVGVVEVDNDAVRAVDLGGSGPTPAPGGPFRGGWIGWVGYEVGATRAGAPATPSPLPGEAWLRVDEFLAFDHDRREVWAWSSSRARADRLAATVSTAPSGSDAATAHPRHAGLRAASVARSAHRPEEYASLVEKCRDRVRAGDAYLLCLTTRFDVIGDADPRTVHQQLRHSAASHHGGVVRFGATALVSASPERFLEVEDGVVRTHPIKGTRPRGVDPASDATLAEELLRDPKERAENVMIVDLMRNDLSRVCAPATVTVERLLQVESYPTVHQLVSTVAGILAPGTTLGRLLDATFPAGSMTGAPKLSAMTILASLEAAARGTYSGCYGWIGDDGRADLAMVIRSVVVYPGGATVGAGGGITWLSVAADEVREIGWKAAAPLAAVGAVLPTGW